MLAVILVSDFKKLKNWVQTCFIPYIYQNHALIHDYDLPWNAFSVVAQEVDYEQANQQFFNLTVIAEDPNPLHTATAYVAIRVRDFNDNAPAIKPKVLTKEIFENEPPGYHVAAFNATDMDSGDNAKFE